MQTNVTVTVSREDLDSLASAFSALTHVIKHCDQTAAWHVAKIFEKYAYDVFDEADSAAARAEGGAA